MDNDTSDRSSFLPDRDFALGKRAGLRRGKRIGRIIGRRDRRGFRRRGR